MRLQLKNKDKRSDNVIGGVLLIIGIMVEAGGVGIGMLRSWSLDASVMAAAVIAVGFVLVVSAVYCILARSRKELYGDEQAAV